MTHQTPNLPTLGYDDENPVIERLDKQFRLDTPDLLTQGVRLDRGWWCRRQGRGGYHFERLFEERHCDVVRYCQQGAVGNALRVVCPPPL